MQETLIVKTLNIWKQRQQRSWYLEDETSVWAYIVWAIQVKWMKQTRGKSCIELKGDGDGKKCVWSPYVAHSSVLSPAVTVMNIGFNPTLSIKSLSMSNVMDTCLLTKMTKDTSSFHKVIRKKKLAKLSC